MAVIKLAQDTSRLSISPWFDKGYVFKSLKLTEQLGDHIATGEIVLTSDGSDLQPIIKEELVTINYQQLVEHKLLEYDIVGYIYARRLLENEVHLSFIVAPNKEFSTESVVKEFKNMTIDQVISSIYPGEVKFLTKGDAFLSPDVSGPLDKLDQNGFTSLDLCYRLCRSYRKDSVYALGLEGLFVKDLTREPFEIYSEGDNMPIDLPKFGYYKEMEFESIPKKPSVNIQPRMYGTKYALTRKDFHADLMDVYQYNTRYLTDMKCRLRLRFNTRFPYFKLGDLVKHKNKHNFNKGKLYVVSWININIEFNNIVFDCELNSWEDTTIDH